MQLINESLVSFTIPYEEKGLVNIGWILGSHSARTDKAMQSLDPIGQYGCVGDSNLIDQYD